MVNKFAFFLSLFFSFFEVGEREGDYYTPHAGGGLLPLLLRLLPARKKEQKCKKTSSNVSVGRR